MIDNAIIYNSQLSINEKFVYIILCSYKNATTRQCYPSVKRMAALSCCSANTVRKALKGLKEKGLISILERKVDKVNCSNLYTTLEIPQTILEEYKNYNISSTKSMGGIPLPMNEEDTPKDGRQEVRKIESSNCKCEQEVAEDLKSGTSKDEEQEPKDLKEVASEYDGQVPKNMNQGTSESWDKLNKHKDINDKQNNITIYDKYENIYKSIVDYLNKKANTNYKFTTKKTTEIIRARLEEGFTLEDFYTVIDKKCYDWMDTEFEKFLRLMTNFGIKFENYLNQKGKRGCENYGKYQNYNAREFN